MNSRSSKARLCAVMCVVLMPSPALAQVENDTRERAIEIGRNAVDLYERRNYAAALTRFRTAEGVLHSPVFLLYEARCLEKLGRLAEARDAYALLFTEPLPVDAAPPWRAALTDAALELAALERRVPSVRFSISGGVPRSLRVDGADRELSDIESEVWLDPGVHELEASDHGGRAQVVRFELREGDRNKRVELAFPAELPAAQPILTATDSQRLVIREPGPNIASVRVSKPATDAWGIALLSTAGAGISAGAVTGLIAVFKLHDIRKHCIGNVCRESDASKGRAVQSLALASTISFSVGAACLSTWGLRIFFTPAVRPGSAFLVPSALGVSGSF